MVFTFFIYFTIFIIFIVFIIIIFIIHCYKIKRGKCSDFGKIVRFSEIFQIFGKFSDCWKIFRKGLI